MDTIKTTAVLFDFDGVVMDTETQYSIFWHKVGVDYLGMDDLESRIKGQTMTYICDTFSPGKQRNNRKSQPPSIILNRIWPMTTFPVCSILSPTCVVTM